MKGRISFLLNEGLAVEWVGEEEVLSFLYYLDQKIAALNEIDFFDRSPLGLGIA